MSSLRTARRAARGWIGIALAAMVMVVAAGFGAHAATAHNDAGTKPGADGSTSSSNQAAAQAAADRILTTFQAPPGSRRTAERPDPVPADLAGPPVQEMDGTQARAVGWYSAATTPAEALSWVAAHPPSGAELTGRGARRSGPTS
ncbi:hypothetical protein ACFQ9X_54845 [Catenulispora yoronensis]